MSVFRIVRVVGTLVLPVGFAAMTAILAVACGGDQAATTQPPTEEVMEKKEAAMGAEQPLPKKIVAPHFVDSYPVHGDKLPQAPAEIVLNFNFNLQANSSISVSRDGQPLPVGKLSISESELSMRAPLETDGGSGVYQVNYQACWPDGSCHEGSVSFVVDSAAASDFVDLRGQSEVVVRMKDGLRFEPARMIISPGTKVTWINDVDDTIHFVNTDPHPSHNVLAEMNSSSLRQGDSYSYTFTKSGAWGYHCSAHYTLGMTAQVIVR